MTERVRLDYSDSREHAWELAEMYAKLAVKHSMPLAIGVRPVKSVNRQIPDGFEVYSVLTAIHPRSERK